MFSMVSGLLYGCEKNESSSEKQKYYTIHEVKEQMKQDMEEAYNGKYDKLSFSSFTPKITDEESISQLCQQRTQYGNKNKTAEQCVKEQYEYICQWLGEDAVDKTKIIDMKSDKTLDEVEKLLQENKYPDDQNLQDGLGMPALLYQNENGVFFSLDSGLCSYEASINNVYYEDNEFIKTYYANAEDGSLEESYTLEDGECTISEAIKFAEHYQNKERPIALGKNFSIEAEQVRVYRLENGKYGFDILMHRVYKGIPFIGLYQGTSISNEESEFDMGIFFMTDRKKPTTCMGLGANEKMTEIGKKYTDIIALSRVFELINEKIGNNTKCTVVNVELAYRQMPLEREFTEYGYCDTIDAEPVWYVEIENGTDDRRTKFFIGLKDYDGENIVTLNVQ